MRKHLHINLGNKHVQHEEITGVDLARAGRYYIAKTLLERKIADVDPLSSLNPLIFSVGPFAGTNFSNANRISLGAKSPLTCGIKEANAGGDFAFALGQLEIAGLTLNGNSRDWVVIRLLQSGEIRFDKANEYLGKGCLFKQRKCIYA